MRSTSFLNFVPTLVWGKEEYLAILEAVKRLFRYFLHNFFHVPASEYFDFKNGEKQR